MITDDDDIIIKAAHVINAVSILSLTKIYLWRKKTMNNKELKQFARKKGVFFWQIAVELGISEATMTRKLRVKLSDQEESKIKSIIEHLSKANDTDAVCNRSH